MKQFKFQTLNKVESDRQFPTEKNLKGFIQYGIYNDFPEYLIYLFNPSPITASTVAWIAVLLMAELLNK